MGRRNTSREDSMLSGASINSQTSVEDRMRRKLKFYFMNPCEKYRAKGRKPWKLALQLFKILMVTLQLVLFGKHQFSVITFQQQNLETFEHLLLKSWDSTMDDVFYPTSAGSYAVYEVDDFYSYLNFTFKRYATIEETSIGTYRYSYNENNQTYSKIYLPPLKVCLTQYSTLQFEQNYTFNTETKEDCANFIVRRDISDANLNKSINEFLPANNLTITWRRLISLSLSFTLKAFHIANPPEIYLFDLRILFDNKDHSGKVLISLDSDSRLDGASQGKFLSENDAQLQWILLILFDVIIILTCLVSAVLCIRSLAKARLLRNLTVRFFKNYYNKDLGSHDRWKFVNCWYVTIIISDILVILGSVFKLQLENKVADNYDLCSITLGTGSLLVWFGILHYLGFFPKYNILIATMKVASPNVLRFMVCVMVLFMGYAFCGWIVLGPYHPKFKDLNVAAECMFSLVNGDDMFATFAEMSAKSQTVWIYSRIFLYTFISLFIYVVLSLFISVIMDTYETIKEYQRHGGPRSDIEQFVSECADAPESGFYRLDDDKNWWMCCCPKSSLYGEYEPLID
ncbi:mucolipin-3-like isoform X2 [Glandiceps talaboti]